MKRTPLRERELPDYTRGEEIFNMTSHIVGGVFGLAALIVCNITAAWHHNQIGIISGSIYGISMILLYTMSAVYHGLRQPMAKKVFQVIDHCTIFILIAGTYTPIMMSSMWTKYPLLTHILLALVLVMAVIGIVLNSIDLERYKKFSMACYLGMGWCILIAAKPMLDTFPVEAIWLLVYGGIAYSVGAIFYINKHKWHYMHSIFHLFVLAGSVFHFICIIKYML